MAKNLNIPLPFYSLLSEQNSKKEYVNNDSLLDDKSILVFEADRLPKFLLMRDLDTNDLSNVIIKIKGANAAISITLDPDVFLEIETYPLSQYIHPTDTTFINSLNQANTYYIEIFDGTNYWYSEVFGVRYAMTDYMKLSFSSDAMLAHIMNGYEFEVFINQVLKVPEYPRFDDAEEKDGIKIYRSQILQKSNTINIVTTPEYLVDSLMMLPMMDNISLILQNGDSIDIQQVELEDPEWTEKNKGATALLTIKLIEYTIIKKLSFVENGDPGYSEEPSVNDGYAFDGQDEISLGEDINLDSSIFINGLLLSSTRYEISGDTIRLITPMVENDHYLVVNYKVEFVVSRDEYIAAGGQSIFNLSEDVLAYVVVAINGLTLNKSEYLTNSNSIILLNSLSAGDEVIITNYIYGIRSTRNDYLATSGQTTFISGKMIKSNILVLVNGLAVDRFIYYTVSNDRIIFTTPASLDDSVILINFNNN